MEALLAITPAQRNYLPGGVGGDARGTRGAEREYGALARAVGAVVELRAVLSEAVLAEMTEAERERLIEARQTAAGLVVMTRQAYARRAASGRWRSWSRRSAVRWTRRRSPTCRRGSGPSRRCWRTSKRSSRCCTR